TTAAIDAPGCLCQVEPRLRPRAAGRAAVLGDAGTRGNVAQSAVGEAHAHQRRRLADGADRVLLVDQDLPDLLGGAVALVVALAGGRAEQLENFLQVGIARLAPEAAARCIPFGEFRA